MRLSAISMLSGRARQFIVLALTGALLAACGGGGGGGTTTAASSAIVNSWGKDATSFFQGAGTRGGNAGAGGAGANGGAGDGAPIRLATVTITDSTTPIAQVATAKTDIDGYYQANITGFKPPLIASVSYTDAAGATVTRYSPSVSTLQTNGFITINITGLTTYLASQVAKAAGGSGASDLTTAMLASPTSTLAAEITGLRTFLTGNLTPALKSEISDLHLDLSSFDPISSQYIPSVKSGYDTILENVSATTPTSTYTQLALKTPLQLAKAMFSELRTTWGTAVAPASTTINDFLITQTAQTKADVNAAVAPNLSKLQNRIETMISTTQLMDDAKAYVAVSNTFGLSSGSVPFGGSGLYRSNGSVNSVIAGTGSYKFCWSDLATGVTTYTRCFRAGSDGADLANGRIKGILFEATSTGTNQYSYTAARYNWAVTTVGPNYVVSGDPFVVSGVPTGSGTASKTLSGTAVTTMAINGTFPPTATLNDAGLVLTGGVDTVVINSVRSALSASNIYHYTLSGSISTPSLADPTKVVTLVLENGSYADTDATRAGLQGDGVAAKLIATVKTTATQFAGTFDLSAPAFDGDGVNRQFTKLSFTGSISNLTGANVGQFLTGKLDMNMTNYASFHSLQPVSTTNYEQGTFAFVGTLQAPLRPLMTVTLNGNTTGPTTGTTTMKYSYGLDVEVNGTTSTDSASATKPVITLTNQNGVQIVLDTTAYTGPITVPGTVDPLAPGGVLGNIGAGVVSYYDGATESFN